jgi:nucleoside 2-deoxyribosyltransferase
MAMRVYLAGPDVFLPEPTARAAALKQVCARHGLEGVSPLDEPPGEPACWGGLPEPHRIARRNQALIRSCQALIANLTPFRGPSADVGTAFEVGFAAALGLSVFGWSNDPRPFAGRTLAFLGANASPAAPGWRDAEGLWVEDFSLIDNLMIEGAIVASGGALMLGAVAEGARWRDLDAFTGAVAALARLR